MSTELYLIKVFLRLCFLVCVILFMSVESTHEHVSVSVSMCLYLFIVMTINLTLQSVLTL